MKQALPYYIVEIPYRTLSTLRIKLLTIEFLRVSRDNPSTMRECLTSHHHGLILPDLLKELRKPHRVGLARESYTCSLPCWLAGWQPIVYSKTAARLLKAAWSRCLLRIATPCAVHVLRRLTKVAGRPAARRLHVQHTNGGRSPQFATSRHVTPIGRHVTRRGKKRAPEFKADGHPS